MHRIAEMICRPASISILCTGMEQQAEGAVPIDPYTLSEDAVREPPTSLLQSLRSTGPGLILAAAIVGTGELIATTHVGAQAGFALLWLVIVSCFIKTFTQIELARYTISSGLTTFAAFRQLPWPGNLLPWWWLGMAVAIRALVAAMVGGIGQAVHMAVPGVSSAIAEGVGLAARPELPWAVLATLLVATLTAMGSYGLVERGATLLVVVFTLMTVGCVALLPWTGHSFGWREISSGLSFQIPDHAVGAAFAMFGITGVAASELIAYPYWCIEKGYARYVGPHRTDEAWTRRARGWLRVMHLDAFLSMVVFTVATLAFYLLGASVLHQFTGPEGLPGTVSGLLQALSRMYVPVLGERVARWFIVIGAFAVLFSTFFVATATIGRTLTDFLHVTGFIRLEQPGDRWWWVRRFCFAFPFLHLCLFVWVPNPVQLVIIGGIGQALMLPMLAAGAVYMRYRRTDRRLTPGLLWDAFLWLSLLGLFAAAIYGVWNTYQKLL